MKADGSSFPESKGDGLSLPPPKCPSCGELLYSQKAKLCGRCGAVLPSQMVFTDEKSEALSQERQWACDLAAAFDPAGRAIRREEPLSPRAKYEAANAAPEELIRRASCVSEFKYRKRPWFWLIFFADAFVLWVFAIVGSVPGIRFTWREWLCFIVPMAIGNFAFWLRAWPICPNCHQDIRTCLAEHCHSCGERLRHQRCADCGVDHSWTGWFQPFSNGMSHWINYCPGCGVELDTWIRRWRANDGE